MSASPARVGLSDNSPPSLDAGFRWRRRLDWNEFGSDPERGPCSHRQPNLQQTQDLTDIVQRSPQFDLPVEQPPIAEPPATDGPTDPSTTEDQLPLTAPPPRSGSADPGRAVTVGDGGSVTTPPTPSIPESSPRDGPPSTGGGSIVDGVIVEPPVVSGTEPPPLELEPVDPESVPVVVDELEPGALVVVVVDSLLSLLQEAANTPRAATPITVAAR